MGLGIIRYFHFSLLVVAFTFASGLVFLGVVVLVSVARMMSASSSD